MACKPPAGSWSRQDCCYYDPAFGNWVLGSYHTPSHSLWDQIRSTSLLIPYPVTVTNPEVAGAGKAENRAAKCHVPLSTHLLMRLMCLDGATRFTFVMEVGLLQCERFEGQMRPSRVATWGMTSSAASPSCATSPWRNPVTLQGKAGKTGSSKNPMPSLLAWAQSTRRPRGLVCPAVIRFSFKDWVSSLLRGDFVRLSIVAAENLFSEYPRMLLVPLALWIV